MARMAKAQYFTKHDLKSSFMQTMVHKPDYPDTHFKVKNPAVDEYPHAFGLLNACCCFQRIMDIDLTRESLTNVACSFINNLNIYSRMLEIQLNHVKSVLTAFCKVNLFAHFVARLTLRRDESTGYM